MRQQCTCCNEELSWGEIEDSPQLDGMCNSCFIAVQEYKLDFDTEE